ncbi:hypothetical protein [Ottowia testudinis]|uniref:Uncharacterized protein n=1 Tax=Ottowia testudinis TaxID=2816950 RepID=A0A975CFL4_9BURK|nr:hypothetical protein [Ottowia testudinis]QTD45515.1 hypothetical protein J1M35_00875 [Ottowia testudinis]
MGAAVAVVAPMLMGGAGGGMLGGLLGGGGLLGQLLGGILGGGGAGGSEGVAKAMQGFSPANVLNAAANLVNAMHGGAVKDAARTLHQEDGMPKFVQDAINKAVDEVLKKNEKPTDSCCQKQLGDAAKDGLKKEMDDLVKQLVDNVRKQLGEESKEATGAAKGGKKSTGSWLQAIAKAMGEVLGQKASEMVKLSDKVSSLGEKSSGLKGEEKQDNAQQMTAAQTELQGVSQEYKLLTETISTVLKGIGEALSTMGRKQ